MFELGLQMAAKSVRRGNIVKDIDSGLRIVW